VKIAVKLISIEGGPPEGLGPDGDGDLEVAAGTTLAQLLARLGLPDDEPYVTLVNDQPVAAPERRTRRLEAGDSVTVFPPIKGGRA
jgi:sulfur carrier protein ThiS